MAKLTVRAENSSFYHFPHYGNHKVSIFSSSLRPQRLNLLAQKHILKLRISCSITERQKEEAAEKQRIVKGLKLNGEVGKNGGLISTSEDELGEAGNEDKEVGFEWGWPPWKNLPQRYKLIGTTSLAFVICNMDKVNLSVAIIPMSHQFGWNSSVAGLVQSSFFWGYALSQLPGGWLSKIFGGSRVLEVGVLVWSLATMLVPYLAGFMPALIFSRILVGIGEGVSPSAATDVIARYA